VCLTAQSPCLNSVQERESERGTNLFLVYLLALCDRILSIACSASTAVSSHYHVPLFTVTIVILLCEWLDYVLNTVALL
jgi:nitrate reductase beta subunit